MEKDQWEFYVAGVKFHQAKTVINELEVDDELAMEQEPDNEYDSNAVAIYYDDIKLGYAPAKISAAVSAFLETAIEPVCKIVYVNPQNKTYEQIRVVIKEYEDDCTDEDAIGLDDLEDENA